MEDGQQQSFLKDNINEKLHLKILADNISSSLMKLKSYIFSHIFETDFTEVFVYGRSMKTKIAKGNSLQNFKLGNKVVFGGIKETCSIRNTNNDSLV